MTEADWLTGGDADRMLAVARRRKVRVGPREQRLLACAWARLLWDKDAGRDARPLLAHCRDDGRHVRGCWAVDLVLSWGTRCGPYENGSRRGRVTGV